MTSLSIGRTDAAPWTMKQLLKDMGLSKQLKSGRIDVAKNGTVTVRDGNRKVAFSQPLDTRADLSKMLKTIGEAVPSANGKSEIISNSRQAWESYRAIRATRFENRVNTRWFRDQDFGTELKEKYRMGRPYQLPMVELPADRVEIMSMHSDLPGLSKITDFFDRGDTRMFPVHPQELKDLQPSGKADAHIPVRCASSDRTLHAIVPNGPEFLLKIPLNRIVHDDVLRPIAAHEAEGSLAMSQYMKDWIDSAGVKDDPFCFFPEAAAVIDTKTDSAAIVRMTQPYPPPADGKKTWTVPAFSLYAPDDDFPKEPALFQRMINNRPDKTESGLDYFERAIMAPLTKSVMRVALDLGSSHVPHGQNLFLEIGADGQPTGRAPHSDLESFWPLPELAKATKRPDFYGDYGYKYAKSKFEAQNWDTFRVYYLEGMLAPLLQAYIQAHPEQAAEVVDRADAMIRSEIGKRSKLVKKFNKPGQPLRMYDRLASGKFKLTTVLNSFFSYETADLIAQARKAEKKAPPPTMSLIGAKLHASTGS